MAMRFSPAMTGLNGSGAVVAGDSGKGDAGSRGGLQKGVAGLQIEYVTLQTGVAALHIGVATLQTGVATLQIENVTLQIGVAACNKKM